MPRASVFEGDELYLVIQVRHGVFPDVYSLILLLKPKPMFSALWTPSFTLWIPKTGEGRLIETNGEWGVGG